jgi:ADP-ribose pyrophosphatase
MHIGKLEKLTSEKWVNLWSAEFDNSGHQGRWVFASRKPRPHTGPDGDAVVLVPVLKSPGEPNRLVLIREFRVPVGQHILGLPAGLIDPGEDIESTARREITEETGLTLTRIKHVSPQLYTSSGITDEAAALAFIDVAWDGEARPTPEGSESIEVVLAGMDDILRLTEDPSVRMDIKAWAVLWMYRQLGRIE